jgi:diguanylate cyclase (GGDEF)-like protein
VRTGVRVAREHGLLGGVGVLTLAVAAYPALPIDSTLQWILYTGIGVLCLALAGAGLLRHRPPHRRGWATLLLGFAGWVVGDMMWFVQQRLLPDTYPAPSDAVYIASYGLIGAGALVMVRTRRGGRDLAALLDAAVVAIGAAVVFAVFVIAPLAHDDSLTLAGKLVSAAYPVGDVFLIAVLCRIATMPGGRTRSYWLLLAALAVTLTADGGWSLLVALTGDTRTSVWTDVGWLAGYVLLAAAAVVPSMRTVAEPAPARDSNGISRRRLVMMAAGAMLPALALIVAGALGRPILWPVIGLGSLLLTGIVIWRMAGLLSLVQVQAVQLTALARADGLTGAPNRRTWDHELSRACDQARTSGDPLTVAILDLDRFKVFNDSYGHQAGDRLLREAVAAWSAALPGGAMLARYGGEEFAVLLPGRTPQEALPIVHALRQVTPQGQTFSAGIAPWSPSTDPGAAVASADEALYRAKHAGRNRVFVHDARADAPARGPGALGGQGGAKDEPPRTGDDDASMIGTCPHR